MIDSDMQPVGVGHLPQLVALKLAGAVDVKPIEGLAHELQELLAGDNAILVLVH